MKEYGYWNDKNNIVNEIELIINKLGNFPTSSQMPANLWTAIKKQRISIHELRKNLKFPLNEKPKGYWNNIDNTKYEIKKLIDKNEGVFPTLNQVELELGSGGKKSVLKLGGIYEVAKIMNKEYRPISATGSYLTTDGHYVLSSYEYLVDEFLFSRKIPHEVNGLILNTKYRYDFKVNDVYIEIWGYEKDRKQKRCINYNERRKIKEQIYLKNNLKLLSIECSVFKNPIKQIFEYLEKICFNNGWNHTKINEINLNNYYNLCKRWNEDKVEHEIKKIIKETSNFPTTKYLKENKKGGLLDAINRHGGFSHFATKLGFKPKKPRGINYWNLETIKIEINKVFSKYPKPPTSNKLTKDGFGYLVQQMYKLGNFSKLRDEYYSTI